MSFFTAQGEAARASMATRFLSDACTIHRKNETLSPGKSVRDEYPVFATGIACKVRKPEGKPQEVEEGDKKRVNLLPRISLPLDTDVRKGDRIVVTSGDDQGTYTVEDFSTAMNPWLNAYVVRKS